MILHLFLPFRLLKHFYSSINMISPSLLSFSIWALCAITSEASWFRRSNGHLGRDASGAPSSGDTSHKTQGWSPNTNYSTERTHSRYYTYSVPTPQVITPTLTSQGMVVTSMVAAYEVCNTPGSNSSSCSTVFENITTSQCSMVFTAWFTSVTITDCDQNITFSTQSSCSLATATNGPAKTPALPTGQSPSPTNTTYLQSIVSYYIAPWQSLAANTPTNITVLVCKFDQDGQETCQDIREVWIIHTKYVPVTSTSTLSLSTSFASVCTPVALSDLLLIPSAYRSPSRSKSKCHCGYWCL
jgi:hypothetical protein